MKKRDKLTCIDCPTCEGVGTLKINIKYGYDESVIKSKAARALRDSGLTVREIQCAMGYKSTRSVTVLLKSGL